MGKLFITAVMVVCFTNIGWSQLAIPKFKHNLVLPDSTFLPPTVPHNAQYEFSITLMHISSTIYKKPFVVLAYDGDKWSVYRWTEQRDTANAGKRSYKIEEIEVSQSQSKNVFDRLRSNSLFELNRKDLNLTSRVTDSGVETSIFTTANLIHSSFRRKTKYALLHHLILMNMQNGILPTRN